MRLEELHYKEVINIYNGIYLGRTSDVELDVTDARVTQLIIRGRLRLFGLLGREDDIVIPWEDIDVVGDDSILVRYRTPHRRPPRGLFR